ncbi:MAG: gfo/Idh/MocA family oxidoreductase, partial [Phototrophicales bacterium]
AAWMRTPAKLAGIHSLDTASLERVAAQTSAAVYHDLDTLIDTVDVVDICAPTHLHHEMVLKAASKGKHIICEKPLARYIKDAEDAIAACRAAGVMLLVAHVVRFFPEYALAQQTVLAGDVGSVGVIRLSRCAYKPYRNDPTSWFHDPAKSGGMIIDLMIHDFDYARWIGGDVESVYARSIGARFENAPIDHALAILTHKNGVLSHIEGGWSYPPPTFRTSFEIAGDRGLIEHPAESSAPVRVHMAETNTASAVALPRSPLDEDPYTTEIKHFYQVLNGDISTPRVTAEDGLEALRIAEAAALSARTGRAVKVSEVSS